jgi:SAM-dependent methyltransferase
MMPDTLIATLVNAAPWRLRTRLARIPWIHERLDAERIARSPDRTVLTGTIFPALRGAGLLGGGAQVLWIGCRRYTAGYYPELEAGGAVCRTLELDPAAARFGNGARHTVGSLTELGKHFAPGSLDLILCNGILGWGVDSPADQQQAFREMAAALASGGWLLNGWNRGRHEDPLGAGLHGSALVPAGPGTLPARIEVPGCTHVFDFYRKA